MPQFIEIEDKIFGPLTWQQFVFVGGGVGLAAVLFFVFPFFIFVIFGLPVAGLGFLLGFYPVNNRPFSIFLQSVVGYFSNTRLYLWRKKGTGVYGADDSVGSSYVPPSGKLSSLSRKLELNTVEKES